MSWWSQILPGEEGVEPFTIALSVGVPDQIVESGENSDSHGAADDQSPYEGRSYLWQQAVVALLHSIFRRGGSIAARFDDQLFPFYWAVARTYADAGPAEFAPVRSDAPLNVVTLDQAWYSEAGDGDDRPIDSVDAFEASGAVRIHADMDSLWSGSVGRRFGIALWPEASNSEDRRIMEGIEQMVSFSWANGPAHQSWIPQQAVQRTLAGEFPAFNFEFELQLDAWLGREWNTEH
jgi:hypothetical protein